MELNAETSSDKKLISNRAKSSGARLRNARKIFNPNEAVKSLDLALCGPRKRPHCSSYAPNNSQSGPLRSATNVEMETSDLPSNLPGMDNSSLMSMNFSHYELLRNLSRSNNSEGAFSDTTNKLASPMDMKMKREHLERYFRSAEMWSHARASYEPCSSTMQLQQFELPENQ